MSLFQSVDPMAVLARCNQEPLLVLGPEAKQWRMEEGAAFMVQFWGRTKRDLFGRAWR